MTESVSFSFQFIGITIIDDSKEVLQTRGEVPLVRVYLKVNLFLFFSFFSFFLKLFSPKFLSLFSFSLLIFCF